ncbi:DUF551 domain-containing protein [Salmonella enterica subsp. enterica]|nr:DUF551 domain-containing protein [Salmonella enterica subsp. enterica serovar Agbeni]EAW2241354.1 DUF551 domain-containing protein [Salmonella enterica subsp. enterica]EBX0814114.1 DUF551 domain-containing protein [Salmonella enterica subsp. enterica serovar Agbeni]EBX3310814.1 DUF551 domain-containing protein [Salmonella enterica subsp. enterica serovar Agbeni]EBY6456912.1 DUF551 domain-containing protein [Salmonella enterica subsp. enterica serovar Agbeni]
MSNKLTDKRTIEARIAALLVADSVPLSDAWGRLIDDAEKMESELQERRKADNQEPAGYHVIRECGKVGCSVTTLEEAEKTRDFWNKKWTIRPYFYAAQPVPVVPDECPAKIRELMASHSDALFNDGDAQEIWNACRTAMLRGNHRDLSQPIGQQVAEYEKIMLQDENFPVTPDGWIKCSDRTPETGQAVIGCVDFDSDIVTPLVREFIWTGSTFRRGVSSTGVKSNDSIVVTHWMPLPAAPKKD